MKNSNGRRTRVLVADPQRLPGESLQRVLAARGFDVLPGCPASGEEALAALAAAQPDVAVIDFRMPNLEGPEIALRAKELGYPTKVILLSWFHGTIEIERALDAGAVGFLTKSVDVDEVAEAIVRAHAGESPVFLDKLEALFATLSKRADKAAYELQDLKSLSRRELDVLTLLSLDRSVKEVADELGLSVATVKMYIRKMLAKTGTFSTQEVLVKARLAGLIRT
ncbi:MAG: response regulator transcription factor [Actinomycetota bacterium]